MRADAFRDKAFVKCGDGGSYYSGPFLIDKGMLLAGAAALDKDKGMMVVQMDTEEPNPVCARPEKRLQDGYQWVVTFNASRIRDRYRLDGVWQPWGTFRNQQYLVVIAALFKRNGEWFASDMRKMGLAVSFLVSAPPNFGSWWELGTRAVGSQGEAEGVLRPTQFNTLLDTIKQPSCADVFAGTVPVKPLAPGHSITDTYARTIEIVKENASKGIPDALTPHINPHPGREWLAPVPVCYSITHGVADPPGVNRKCDPTGELVRVPGDLDVPSDFWESYDRRCKNIHMQGPGLEIKLKDSGHDDHRKRFISCTEIFLLGALRKQLIDLGFGK